MERVDAASLQKSIKKSYKKPHFHKEALLGQNIKSHTAHKIHATLPFPSMPLHPPWEDSVLSQTSSTNDIQLSVRLQKCTCRSVFFFCVCVSKGKLVEEEDAWLVVERKWPVSVASWINKALQRHEWMHDEKKAHAAGLLYTFSGNNNTWKAKKFGSSKLGKKNKKTPACLK